jgi:MFS family permease
MSEQKLMPVTAAEPRASGPSGAAISLAPIIAVVFIAYLVIGLAMPVLPLHVHRGLGLSTFVVGLVAGSQFAAAIITRPWAGHFVDTRGAKNGVLIGLSAATASGALYLLSLRLDSVPETSVLILLLGRAVLGAAESFIITGALSWGLGLLGSDNTGKVMSWVGTALYAALAVGAPAGSALYAKWDFLAIGIAATFVPLVTLPLALSLRTVATPTRRSRTSITSVVGAVWVPGAALAISGVGFAAVTTFVVLLFELHGWGPAWAAFTALSTAFIAGRLVFGHLPDRVGGARVALVCVLIEAAGLTLVWLAPSFATAVCGVTLTRLGYSLVYPGFGVEALRRVPPQSRGLAMGTYTAFLDLSLGISSPALGLVAGRAGLDAVFLVSALVVLGSAAVALRLTSPDSPSETILAHKDGT